MIIERDVKATEGEAAFGFVLRRLRSQRGLTQEQLAERAGMHRNYVGHLERGKKSPTLKTTGRILKVLGLSWSEFGAAMDEDQG